MSDEKSNPSVTSDNAEFVAQAKHDIALYGQCFIRECADGTLERVPLSEWPESAPAPMEKGVIENVRFVADTGNRHERRSARARRRK